MIRKSFCGKGLVAVALLGLLATPALAGETVAYPGGALQTVGSNPDFVEDHPNSLAPSGSKAGKSASVSGNSVTLDSGTVGGVFGATNITDNEAVSDNSVIINGGTVSGWVTGAMHVPSTGAATAINNKVVINGGDIAGDVTGARMQGVGAQTSTGNSVSITGGAVTAKVIDGGFTSGIGATGAITASGNSVSITGGTVTADEITGGFALSVTSEDTATASGNTVIINGGDVTVRNVLGGYADGASTGVVTASGNNVVVQSGKVTGLIIGGVAGTRTGDAPVATATNNSVAIHKVPGQALDLSGATIAGGYRLGDPQAGDTDVFAGNTLNVQNDTNQTITVKSVRNIETYNFIVSDTQGSTPMLTVSGDLYLDDSYEPAAYTHERSSAITASTVGGAPLAPGSEVRLFDVKGTVHADDFDAAQVIQGRHGAVLKYRSTLNPMTGVLTLDSVEVNPQAKALSEGFLGGLALTTQGADLIAGQGMGNAVSASADNGFGAFAAIAGGRSRYDTGSHVDMSSVSLMTGPAWSVDTTPGHLTLGAFFEFGTGSYDTGNSFSNAASVDGDGDTYYTGGGILGRMDFANTGPGRFYTEASARMGKVHNEYESSDLRDPIGRNADYDSSSLYYGLHFGAGYIWDITDKASLDLYGKYFWTRQEGDSVTLSTDDPVTFRDADSQRLRGGARFAYSVNDYVSPYVGAAYEHEFDGKARASTYGYSIDAPSLRGDTGIGEIGLTLKPSVTLPLSFDLGVQGYTGQREGVTGSLQAKFEF